MRRWKVLVDDVDHDPATGGLESRPVRLCNDGVEEGEELVHVGFAYWLLVVSGSLAGERELEREGRNASATLRILPGKVGDHLGES